jgi:hypothetical protein
MRIAKNFITIITFLALFCFVGCTKDKQHPGLKPEIKFLKSAELITSDTTLSINQKVKIGIEASSKSGAPLTQLTVISILDENKTSIDSGLFSNEFHYYKEITKGLAKSELWQFYVKDRDGNCSDTICLKLHLDENSGFGPIQSFENIVLGAQLYPDQGSFYSYETNQTYSISEAFNNQQMIDLLYYFDVVEADAHTIASPGANIDAAIYNSEMAPGNWATRTTLRFEYLPELTTADFESCTNDSLILANTFVFGSGKRKAKNLSSGDIYAFVSETDERGIFLIQQRQGDADGFIQFSIKMQEP